MNILPLLTSDYIKSIWGDEFATFVDSGVDKTLRERITAWDKRDKSLSETQLEQTFIGLFFTETWGYWGPGARSDSTQYTLYPQYKIDNAGQQGGRGSADLALGFFNAEDLNYIPQVLCEFKDIKSSLDAPQKRQGNNRSPVKQCFDYLKYSFDSTDSNARVVPSWGIVTDMNEFRLYSRKLGMSAYQQFFIRKPKGSSNVSLLEDSEKGSFQRFVFQKVFQIEMLLADFGKSKLEKVIEDQRIQEKNLEKEFYKEYQSYREFVFSSIQTANNNSYTGTPGKLVQLTQRLLDRCIFILFCEDMGSNLNFPTNLLRNILIDQSKQQYYDPNHDNIWSLVKQLFRTMRDGGPFTDKFMIPHFNGGLFSELPELENLTVPNKIFCGKGQGESARSLLAYPKTLLYFSSKYNFGASGDSGERTITLYTLGRIFEQSITDLEYMESEAEGKTSIAHLNKRKRNGVYYTPEWVTEYIVRETIGAWLADRKKELGLEIGVEFSQKAQDEYTRYLASTRKNKKKPKNEVTDYLDKLSIYRDVVENLKVLDPSCGSGAFLIQSLNYLLAVRTQLAVENERIEGRRSLFDVDTTIREILSKNIYGVDLNPESVEITQLALWLNTAVPGKPLSKLDKHIQSGNSLVGPDFIEFYNKRHQQQASLFGELPEVEKEKINIFDWEKAFPEVFGENVPADKRGFDCIVGNPPYVKYQNFRTIQPDESDYYLNQKDLLNFPLYQSAQYGNYDIYTLFIEKSIRLLSCEGKMGIIAPNVWLKSEYGKGLRRLIKRTQSLDRWLDFGDFQVFDDAITYTAIQFYCKEKANKLRYNCVGSRIDSIPKEDSWEDSSFVVYTELVHGKSWDLTDKMALNLMSKINSSSMPLGDLQNAIVGFRGIETGADKLYHFHRLSRNKYVRISEGVGAKVRMLEDELMKNLVSGPHADRYSEPISPVYVLFPYTLNEKPKLLELSEIKERYSNIYIYLKEIESELRARENGKMDHDDKWWGYVYPKNLDKQEKPKIGIPQTIQHMKCFLDEHGSYYFNNVRVGGLIAGENISDLWWLLGVLNSQVTDFYFRQIAKPKSNGYFEANKQYLTPLPIPHADSDQRQKVSESAEQLQTLTTRRRDFVSQLQARLDGSHCVSEQKDESWIWAEVKSVQKWKDEAPEELSAREKTKWAKEQREAKLCERLERLDALLKPGSKFVISEDNGEVSFSINGQVEITAFVSSEQGQFLAAQWDQVARTTNITEKFQSKTLVKRLLNVRSSDNEPFILNTVEINQKIKNLDDEISSIESSLNSLIYDLYGLSDDEISMVEAG